MQAQGNNVQRVYPTPERQTRPASNPVAIDVSFTTSNNLASFTGLGLRVHWDSRKLSFQAPTNILDGKLLALGEPQSDSQNYDEDPATDQFILIAWNDVAGNWPGQVPIQLLSLKFSAAPSFSGSTQVRFTASSVAPGYDFSGTPAVVESASSGTTTTQPALTTTTTSIRPTTTIATTSTTQRASTTTLSTPTSTTSTTLPQTPGEPTAALQLAVNPALGCPGFYIADVALAPGARSGIWGVEVLVSAGEKLLQGGLNLGGAFEADGRNNAWGAFSIVNPRNEPQIVRLRLDAQALPTSGFDSANLAVDVRVVDGNRNPVGSPVQGRPPLSLERTLNPGFYIVEVRSLSRSPQGTFQLSAETSFVDRAGGGFQGGAVVGGFLTRDTAGNSLHGYAAVCISEAQPVTFKTYGPTSYGSSGAGYLVLTVSDWDRRVVWQSPVPATTSATTPATTTTSRIVPTTVPSTSTTTTRPASTTTTTRATTSTIPSTTTTTLATSNAGYAHLRFEFDPNPAAATVNVDIRTVLTITEVNGIGVNLTRMRISGQEMPIDSFCVGSRIEPAGKLRCILLMTPRSTLNQPMEIPVELTGTDAQGHVDLVWSGVLVLVPEGGPRYAHLLADFDPSPVSPSDDGTRGFKLRLREVNGVGVRVTSISIDGLVDPDAAKNILGPDQRLNAGESVETRLLRYVPGWLPASGSRGWEWVFTGNDDNGHSDLVWRYHHLPVAFVQLQSNVQINRSAEGLGYIPFQYAIYVPPGTTQPTVDLRELQGSTKALSLFIRAGSPVDTRNATGPPYNPIADLSRSGLGSTLLTLNRSSQPPLQTGVTYYLIIASSAANTQVPYTILENLTGGSGITTILPAAAMNEREKP